MKTNANHIVCAVDDRESRAIRVSAGPFTWRGMGFLLLLLLFCGLSPLAQAGPISFTPTGSLGTARTRHTATVLLDGKVLVAGGRIPGTEGVSDFLASAEIYDPATGLWSATGPLVSGRYDHTAFLLPDGKVLISAGVGVAKPGSTRIEFGSEIYDPETGSFSVFYAAPRLASPVAALLPSGHILFTGCRSNASGTGDVFIEHGFLLNPTLPLTAQTMLMTGDYDDLNVEFYGRYENHTLTLLADGKVLLAAGDRSGGNLRNDALIYNPASNRWEPTGFLASARRAHTAQRLGNGKVLVAGGQGVSSGLASSEIYDPATALWTATGSLATARSEHTGTMLPDNTVLVTGGLGAVGRVGTSEIYTSATGVWSAVGPLNTARNKHTASLLPDGRILIVGGETNAGPLASAELGFAPPAVAAISPATGSTLGGTSVTVTGTNFVGVTGVKVGGTNVTSFSVVSLTSITAVAPAHAVGSASVVVTTPGGSNVANTLYTFIAPPIVTAISPGSGSTLGGNTVTLTGSGFTGATGVRIGGTTVASFTVVSATSITAITPAHAAGTASVVVTTPGESNAANTLYTFVSPPTVTSITPTSGGTVGGTNLTITGTNFTGATSVTIGGTAATGVTVASATSITAVAPPHAAGVASIVVTTVGGSNAANTLYTFIAPPTVTAISPNNGSIVGGTQVTISGTNFTAATGVTIGGTAATSFTVASATSIVATIPAHAAGPAGIVVTTIGGSNAANTLYTFIAPPTVTAIGPASGSTLGGDSVMITGTGFNGPTSVTLGGTAATNVTVLSTTSITATAPAHTAGTASVVVTNLIGSNAGNTLYTFVAPPTVTAISPGSGSTLGGTGVTITGTNFTGATGLSIGGTAATSFMVVSATSITAVTPAHVAGAASVVVTKPGGSNGANALFSFVAPPVVTAISSGSGSTLGGNSVTLTGTGFTAATGVTIGGVAATSFTVVSATSITAITPAHAAGVASVVVTTPYGSNAANTLYTFTAPPTVTAISLPSGSTVGGASVTLTGTGFTAASNVTLGGTAATSFTVVNATSITAVTPAHAAGPASVIVTTSGGSNAANTLYTFIAPPIITAIAPSNGSTIGGTTVTLTGSSFTGATAVTIGGVPATNVTVASPTSLTATTGANAPGLMNVAVTASGVTGSGTNLFTYLVTPTSVYLNPPGGSTTGGTIVSLYGVNFTGTTGVTFGGTAATSFTVNSDTKITATAPAHAAGPVNVVVTRPLAAGTVAGLFTYATVSSTTDTDGDGLNDAAEFQLAALGFNWQSAQASLVSSFLTGNALFTRSQYDLNRTAGRNDVINAPNTYSLYTLSQIQDLDVGVPLLAKDVVSGKFKLTLGVQKSLNLASVPFAAFPMNSVGMTTVINAAGKLEFVFPGTDNAAFFRVQSN